MKIKLFLFTVCLAPMCSHSHTEISDRYFLGNWKCYSQIIEQDDSDGVPSTTTMTSTSEASFIRGGGLNIATEFRIELEAEDVDLYSNYLVISSNRWRIEEGFLLIENRSNQFSLREDNGLAEFFYLPDLLPEGLTDASAIEIQSDTEVLLISQASGVEELCERLPPYGSVGK